MSDGLVVPRGGGRPIGSSGVVLKLGADRSSRWSVFEVDVQPGFDVGAHVHGMAEELFYVLEGELDLLAFEPRTRTASGWQNWESHDGGDVVRGGPGTLMHVPAGCPHAFANPGPAVARMLLHVAPAGHEFYLEELAEVLDREGRPSPIAIAHLRAGHDIEQLTPLIPARG